VLQDEGRAALQKNADWLRKWGATRITLEGHADSRGTTEYNLALGDRRAQATRDYLVSLGISADRILTISKGKESPFCTEEVESCWSQNRRGHFVITAK
jgi:peptidoglycan-associated lipoprotein